MIHYIKLPAWRIYLYDLLERIRIYKRINLKKSVPGFGTESGDYAIIKHCLIKFGRRDVLRKKRTDLYNAFVDLVEQNQSRVTQKEFRIAVALSRIKKLKLEELKMEISELKKFGKEVGLGFSDMKGLDEEELVLAIIQKVDPKNTRYSPDFVDWYDALPESLFNTKDNKKEEKKDEFDKEEVTDAIVNADNIKEVKEIVELFPDVFPEKLLKIKDMEELQEAMVNIIENKDVVEEVKTKKEKGEKTIDKETLSKSEIKEAINMIKESDDASDLREMCKSYTNFEEVELRGKVTVESLQKRMLAALGVESEEDEKPKKKASKKEESAADELNAMSLLELKKFAKENDINVPFGTTKDDTISMILEAMGEEGDKKDQVIELNPSLVKEMVKEKDLEGLQEAASQMGITLKALQKRNAKVIGELLIEALSEKEDKKPAAKEKASPKKKASVWETVKSLVEDGETKKAIIKKVVPMLEELGIEDEDEAKEKIGVLIEIANAEA